MNFFFLIKSTHNFIFMILIEQTELISKGFVDASHFTVSLSLCSGLRMDVDHLRCDSISDVVRSSHIKAASRLIITESTFTIRCTIHERGLPHFSCFRIMRDSGNILLLSHLTLMLQKVQKRLSVDPFRMVVEYVHNVHMYKGFSKTVFHNLTQRNKKQSSISP